MKDAGGQDIIAGDRVVYIAVRGRALKVGRVRKLTPAGVKIEREGLPDEALDVFRRPTQFAKVAS